MTQLINRIIHIKEPLTIKENDEKNAKCKIDDNLKISKNKKIFLQKVTLQIGWKKFLRLKKVKNPVPWT